MALRRSFHPSNRSPRGHDAHTKHGYQRGFRIAAAALLASSLPLTGATAAFAAPIDGAPSIGDTLFAGIGNTGYDVLHYDVDIHYAHEATGSRAAGSVVATTTITAHAPAELGSFSLDFEGMTVDSVTVNGAAATFTRSADKPTEAYKLYITPAAPVSGEFTVVVNYSGVPTRHIDNDGSSEGWVASSTGVIALGQPVGTMAWLPSNNTPADKATFDVALTIPTEMNGAPASAVSNGELVSKVASEDGLETTWNWKQLNQQATMSTMLGIGNYDVYEGTITLLDGRQIPEWTFVDSTLNATQKANTEARRQDIQKITQFLESKYGPYPGNSTGFIVHRSNVGYALETQDRSYFPSQPGESTFVHEIAHQWFGAAVTPNDWNNIWISEGQASYAATMYMSEVKGGTSTADSLFRTWTNTAAGHRNWQTPTAAMTDQVQLFNWQVYTRGSMTYEALRQVLGDEQFFAFLTEWIQTNNGTSRSTAEFIALAEEMTGKDLGAFFQDWLYDADKPAWPSVWSLDLSSDPAPAEVERGSEIIYTLTAANRGQVPLSGSASVDLADVLDDARIDTEALDPTLTLDGTTLTWAVPETALEESASVSYAVTVDESAYDATLGATASGTLGAQCGECSVTHTTAAVPEVTVSDLIDENRGSVSVPATAEPGERISVTLGTADLDGRTLSALLFEPRVDLGGGEVNDGKFSVQIPADAALGDYRVAVLDEIGLLIGWDNITLVAPPVTPGPETPGEGTPGTPTAPTTPTEQLSQTGADPSLLWLVGGAAALLLVSGGIVLAVRKRLDIQA